MSSSGRPKTSSSKTTTTGSRGRAQNASGTMSNSSGATDGRTQNRNVNNTATTTPTSSTNSAKISMSSSYLPYQYRREVKIPCTVTAQLPSRTIDPTHRSIRVGLGSAAGNLRVSHMVNSKKDSLVNSSRKKVFIRGSSKKPCHHDQQSVSTKKTTPGGDPGGRITSRMKMLTIYESPKSSRDFISEQGGIRSTNCRINPTDSVMGKVFLTLNKKVNYIAALNRKVTFTLSDGTSIIVQPSKKNSEEEGQGAIMNLCRHFRNILGWKLSIHLSWKYAEEKIQSWYSTTVPASTLSVEEVGVLLKASADDIRNFAFDKELELIFTILRKNLCHTTCPNIAKLLAFQKIQQGNPQIASRFIAEQCGMYLHSEIIDKHLTFIRRKEETRKDVNCDNTDTIKSEIFWEQVNETLKFSSACFAEVGDNDFRRTFTFHPDWNIVQISTSVKCTNRFGYDLIGKQLVPQLLLNIFGFIPGARIKSPSEFTTFCSEPKLEQGSSMRHGLIEAFEKLLDSNLTISDEKIIITRKKYWEERGKHNDSVEAIMHAMEDWIFPWTFMLAGTIKDKSIQQRILKEVLSHLSLKNCSDSQKFVIYRLTEGYNILPFKSRNVIDSIIAHVLQVDEDLVQSLAKKIFDVGSCISCVEPRNPTILILDQDIDILPWDWLPCLRTTDVTRMPSLNLINSTQMLTKFIGGSTHNRPIDKDKCTFVLNPDCSLPQVQTRLEKYFTDRISWTPVVGRSPTTQEMENALENQDIFLYCGHGAGSSFYPEYAVQKLVCKAIPILMGCSSAQSHFSGPGLYSYSSVHAYFTAGCTSVVGFLWEVTDTECDRITADFVERWLPHPFATLPKMPLFDSESKREYDQDLSSAFKKSRTAATQLLTQCAAVCYGIPIVKTF